MSAYTELEDWYEPDNAGKYRRLKEMDWEIGKKDSGHIFVVPGRGTFDVSIPRWIAWIFTGRLVKSALSVFGVENFLNPHNPKYLKAASLHDELLEQGWDRPTSGAAFNDALFASGVGGIERLSMFLAVTLWKWK